MGTAGRTQQRLVAGSAGVVLAAGLLGTLVPAPAQAAVAPAVQPSLAGARAVRGSTPVVVSGSAPAGTIVGARLVGTEQDGGEVAQVIPPETYDPAGATSGDTLRLADGRLSGRLTTSPCYFDVGRECGAPEPVRSLQLEVTVRTAAGSVETGRSAPLRVDFTRPQYRKPELIAPDQVRIRWTEPVRHPQQEAAADFSVERVAADGTRTSVPVLSVSASTGDCVYSSPADEAAGPDGCTRTLTLGGTLGEDETPLAEYHNSTKGTGGTNLSRDKYTDYSSNVDGRSNDTFFLNATSVLDLIRPAAPTITAIAGRPVASGTVTGGAVSGDVAVSNVIGGHAVRLRVTAPDGTAADSEERTVPAGATSVSVPLPAALGSEGRYTIKAIAFDRATGARNASDETAKRTARADGTPTATYVLDTVAPELRSALLNPDDTITVTWGEAVQSASQPPGDWKVRSGLTTYPVTAVTGSGAARTLTVGGNPPAGSEVTHVPSSAAATYTDQAGNEAGRGPAVLNGVPLPTVAVPAGPRTFYTGDTATVAGTATPGTRVDVHRDADNDGRPDLASVLASQVLGVGQTAYSVTVPLNRGNDLDTVVTATDPSTGAVSRAAEVGTLVQDADAPVVTISAPTGGVYAGGGQVPLTFRVGDKNRSGVVSLAVSTDGGATFQRRPDAPADGAGSPASPPVTLPDIDAAQALIEVTAVDRAGRSTTARSLPFRIDAVAPSFTARTGPDTRTVTVLFNEVVSGDGRTRGGDWLVDGVSAVSATSTDETVNGVRRTVTVLTVARSFGRNDLPAVVYRELVPPPLGTPLRDEALQEIEVKNAGASDGIAPTAPVVREPGTSRTTRDQAVQVSGTGEPGSVVEVRRGTVVVGRSGTIPTNGSWVASASLLPDADNDLNAVATDTGGNLSGAVPVPRIVQDATGPLITIDAPADGTQLAPGQPTTISWRTSDRNPANLPVTVLVSTDGGVGYTVLGRDQAPSSSFVWSVPDVKTGKALVRVDAVDNLGNTTRRTTGFLGIGQPADAGTPPPVVVEVMAVTVSVNDRTITAGNAPLISGTATDADGSPVAGEPIRVFQKVWGQSAYTTLALSEPVRTDSAGRYALRVRPDRQRSYVVQVGAAKSRPLVIAVFNRVNVARPLGGQAVAGGATTVVGDLDPDFASVRVGIAVLRNGRFSYLTQGLTDSTGAYSIPVRGLPRGDYALVVYTSARLGTGAGAASRAVRVS